MIITVNCTRCKTSFRMEAFEPEDLKSAVCYDCAELIAANCCENCDTGCNYPLREDLEGYKLCEDCYDESMIAAKKAAHSAAATMQEAA